MRETTSCMAICSSGVKVIPHLGAVALVEFDRERILRITARRPGGFVRLPAVTLHLHDDFYPVRIVRIDLGQAFQFGQIFRIDIAVKFEQRAVLVVVVTRQLVQVVEFPLHVGDGGVHELGNIRCPGRQTGSG